MPGAPATELGQALRQAATTLAQTLTAIEADTDATSRERAADARAAIDSARRTMRALVGEARGALARVDGVATAIDSSVAAVERNLGPLAVERVRRLASRIEALSAEERAKALVAAVDARDVEQVLAASLVQPTDPEPRRAMAALAAGEHLAKFLDVGGPVLAGVAAAEAAAAAVEELAQQAAPWDRAAGADPGDLFTAANSPWQSAGVDVAALVPTTWSPTLRELAVGAAQTPARSPEASK